MSTEFIPAAKPIIGAEERAAVDAVLVSGMLAQGAQVKAFEEEFSEVLVDGRAAIAVNSGTAGLHLGLLASGIGSGDEVIVPSFTFAATANSVALTGATPVFADIDIDTFTLDPSSVESVITDKTAGIMPVHLYGHPARVPELLEITKKHNLHLFEDAAQAHGATVNDAPVGSFGSFAMFSLYPTKNMTSGEGGIITTGDLDVERKARLLRNQGQEIVYQNELVGFNARMTEIHAAIGREQLKKVRGWTEIRQKNAAFFDANLYGVVVPKVSKGSTHVYHQYTILINEDRDGFQKALREEYNIGSGVYYPVPNHRLPSFQRPEDLPVTEQAAKSVLSIPVYPSLTDSELERIVVAVNALAKAGA